MSFQVTKPSTVNSSITTTSTGPSWFLPNVQTWTVGFDRHWSLLNMLHEDVVKTNYPPYNILKKDDSIYVIELALAGFTKEEIKIDQTENVLTVRGTEEKEAHGSFIHKGIGTRDFVREFALADYVEVVEAEFVDGILRIILIQEVPEEAKPKYIKIK
jgi:molecular chaperone IbpA